MRRFVKSRLTEDFISFFQKLSGRIENFDLENYHRS